MLGFSAAAGSLRSSVRQAYRVFRGSYAADHTTHKRAMSFPYTLDALVAFTAAASELYKASRYQASIYFYLGRRHSVKPQIWYRCK